jgi:integrase
MNHPRDSKLANSQSPVKTKKRRAIAGNPQPYRDGNRWKAKGYYLDLDGNRRHVTGTGSTQTAATARKEKLIKERLKQQQASRIPDGVSTVGAYCSYWLDKVKQPQDQLAYKTYVGYESAIRVWIAPNIGKLKLVDLKRQHLISLLESIRVAGRTRSTQNQVRAVLMQALEHAVSEEHIHLSPFRAIKLMKQKRGVPEYFEFDEAAKIMRAARALNQELNLDIQFNYGMRQAERLGLTWSDIDLDAQIPCIRLTQQLQLQKDKGKVRVALKSNSCQVFYPTEYTVELLKSQRAAFDLGKSVHGEAWNSQGFVFWNSRGNPIDATSDRKTWIKILQHAGIDYKVGHTTRKTTGTLMEDPEAAFAVLGHKQQSTMYKHYRAARDQRKTNGIAKLQKQILES